MKAGMNRPDPTKRRPRKKGKIQNRKNMDDIEKIKRYVRQIAFAPNQAEQCSLMSEVCKEPQRYPSNNAIMESFYCTLKRELVQNAGYDNPKQVRHTSEFDHRLFSMRCFFGDRAIQIFAPKFMHHFQYRDRFLAKLRKRILYFGRNNRVHGSNN